MSNLQKTMATIMMVLVVISITLCVIVLIYLLAGRHINVRSLSLRLSRSSRFRKLSYLLKRRSLSWMDHD